MTHSLDDILRDFDAARPLAEARTIPGSWYTDTRVEGLEKRAVFGGTWQVAARLDQLQKPGDYVTTTIAGEPIVVVRDGEGVLRAFFNVCRHHAAAVMTEAQGCAERLRCPYHGWTYGLEGDLKSTPEMDGVHDFDKTKWGLVPVRVAAWEQFVFVCLDEGAPSLDESLGSLAPHVAKLGLTSLTFAERREYELRCNWKVFVDNYLDGGYHVPYLHRGLNSILSFREYTIETFDRWCLQSSPIDTSPQSEAMTASVRKGQAFYYWLYPNFMLNWYEGYLDTNLVVPLGIDRMKVVFDFYFAETGGGAGERNAKSMDVSERIQDEDHAICESVQRGLSSRAYGAGRLSVRREGGENLFHRLLAADLRGAKRHLT